MTLAHQGGWDELLFVLLPLLIFALLLWVAARRAGALEDAADDAVDEAADTPPDRR